jgi:hypothetical protein
MNRLNTGFSRVSDGQLVNIAQSVIAALTGNEHFPALNPSLATVGAALAELRVALAMPRGIARNAAINGRRPKLVTLLEQLARNLELTPGVTDAMLATSGFWLRRMPTRTSAAVDAPANVRLKATGTSGQLQVLCRAVGRARAYQVQFTQHPNGDQWNDGGVFASTRAILINGLTRGKDYWARVRAIGPAGPGPWSDPATAMAL